jgi:hypothetical protein
MLGLVPFAGGGDSFWPIMVSILNLPPVLRLQFHCGLPMVGLDDGSKAIWQAVVADFLDLWEHGWNGTTRLHGNTW